MAWYDLLARGYLPLDEAAQRMDLPEEQVADMARRGVLRSHLVRGDLWVQPAIVTG